MPEDLNEAVRLLQSGGLVALPTETVYGLAADARNEAAVARIFEAKGRPNFNPLIVHVPSLATAETIGAFGPVELKLARAFWPGPLTIVVPLRVEAGLSSLVTAGLATVAIRVPGHPLMQSVLTQSGLALAAPSANRSGRISPTTAKHVQDDLGSKVDLVLDGGETSEGLESTIVKVDESTGAVHVLRPGTVTLAALRKQGEGEVIAAYLPDGDGKMTSTECGKALEFRPEAPGQLLAHYAPSVPVRLSASDIQPGEGLLGFGAERDENRDKAAAYYNLSESADLAEAARRLYAGLHYLDGQGVSGIAVKTIPAEGIGLAINDRLSRAAAGSVAGNES